MSATEHVINYLTKAIADGTYQAGERLIENKLTEELDVGRGPIREAFRRLHSDGLIELQPNRGAIVRSFGREDVEEILAIREVMEGFAAALATQNIDKHDNRSRTEEMLRHVEQLLDSKSQVDFLADNSSFHHFIISLSGNKTLAHQIDQLQKPAIRSWFFNQLQDNNWSRSLNEHKLILEAILDKDAALAEQLMRAHIRRTKKLFSQLPEEVFDGNTDK